MILLNEGRRWRNSSSVRHGGRIVGGNRFSTEETERMTRIISSVPRQTMEIRSSLARYRRALRKRFCLAAVLRSLELDSGAAGTGGSHFKHPPQTQPDVLSVRGLGR